MATSRPETEQAILAGGCFWCLEAVFELLDGVEQVENGYADGQPPHPTYEQVCTGTTGHAEVVRVTFRPSAITFKEILDVFFSIHDPTTLDRQGPDMGPQYRSAIFYLDDAQKTEAESVIRELSQKGVWDRPIVTEVAPLTEFYQAEDYHQQYFQRNGHQPYCQIVVAPKVAKARKAYAAKLKEDKPLSTTA